MPRGFRARSVGGSVDVDIDVDFGVEVAGLISDPGCRRRPGGRPEVSLYVKCYAATYYTLQYIARGQKLKTNP